MDTLFLPVIISGGVGSRLWPLSRKARPKPFIKLKDGESFLQKTFLRLLDLPNQNEILTITNQELFFATELEYEQVSSRKIKSNFILEPIGKNTAAAIAMASLFANEQFGEETILMVTPADHLISEQEKFNAAVARAIDLAKENNIVVFGIKPTYPETGYGYIQNNGSQVISFIEKPNLEQAKEFIASGEYLWNSGMFCFKAKIMLEEMTKLCPEILTPATIAYENADILDDDFSKRYSLQEKNFQHVVANSIDYAVMEKTDKAVVVPCSANWRDIGNWQALGDILNSSPNANNIHTENSKNCSIFTDNKNRLICTLGVNDLIIADTSDALLIADKKNSQEVKVFYDELIKENHSSAIYHDIVFRPWGSFTVISEGENFKIKKLEIKSGQSISLQKHEHRSEHWVVINGNAKVRCDDKTFLLKENESTYIPQGSIHRLENPGKEALIIIEVQRGDYLGEDDIIRLEDKYHRV